MNRSWSAPAAGLPLELQRVGGQVYPPALPRPPGAAQVTKVGQPSLPIGSLFSSSGVFAWNGDSFESQDEENRKDGFGKMTYRSNTEGEEDEDAPDENAVPCDATYLGHYSAGKRGCQANEPDFRRALDRSPLSPLAASPQAASPLAASPPPTPSAVPVPRLTRSCSSSLPDWALFAEPVT
ncbi:unnamed protein product, partial [Polarella glacialis]